jgi:mannose-6-phosphate isomerase-like protein (cupin superfamily)
MLQQIHSKIYPDQLLVSVITTATDDLRTDAAGAEEILQVSFLKLPQSKTIQPHRHLPVVRTTHGTNEAWIVISGTLQAQVFDIDASVVDTVVLGAGDCMVLYRGGHNFTALTDDALVYEIKNGPYYGSAVDSERIQ